VMAGNGVDARHPLGTFLMRPPRRCQEEPSAQHDDVQHVASALKPVWAMVDRHRIALRDARWLH